MPPRAGGGPRHPGKDFHHVAQGCDTFILMITPTWTHLTVPLLLLVFSPSDPVSIGQLCCHWGPWDVGGWVGPCPTLTYPFSLHSALDRVLSLLRDGLMEHPGGLELGVLKKAVRRGLGVDLEDLSWDMGFRGTLELLSNLPGVWVWGPEKGDHCILHMERGMREPLTVGVAPAGRVGPAHCGRQMCLLEVITQVSAYPF